MATGSAPGKDFTCQSLANENDTIEKDLLFCEATVETCNSFSNVLPLQPPPMVINDINIIPYFEKLRKSDLSASHAFEEWRQNKHLIRQEVLYLFCLECYYAAKQSPPVDLSQLDQYWAGFFKGVALERTLSLNDTLSTLLSKFQTILHQSNLYLELQSLLNIQVISVSEGQVVMTKATLERLEAGIAKLENLLSKMEAHDKRSLKKETGASSHITNIPLCVKNPLCLGKRRAIAQNKIPFITHINSI